MSSNATLLLAILVPLLGAVAIPFCRKRPNLREGVQFGAAAALLGVNLSLIQPVLAGTTLQYTLFELLPGLRIALRADSLSMIFALVASSLWVVAVFYTAGYMRGLKEHAQTRFNTCFALAIFGAMGCAFSDNLFTLFLFYEIVSIGTYPLVAHHQDKESYEGARKYIAYLTFTAKGLVLPAMILLYVHAGTLDFALNIQDGIVPDAMSQWMVTAIYICMLVGFAKNGVMPFHHWLPGAMVAPTPVSALLHAVAVVKVGVFSTVRMMLYVFGTDTMAEFHLGMGTALFVSFTIILASVIALTKDNLKARLAYSTVSQLSYIILGVALLTPMAIEGGLLHIASHAFAKITLFFCAGAIYVAAHKKNISEMDGLARCMPFTYAAFGLASLTMIGIPPAAGFISKWYMLNGAYSASAYIIIAVLLTSTVLNAAYFVPVLYRGVFAKRKEDTPQKEAHPAMLIPLCLTAVISILLGIWPEFFLQFAKGVL